MKQYEYGIPHNLHRGSAPIDTGTMEMGTLYKVLYKPPPDPYYLHFSLIFFLNAGTVSA